MTTENGPSARATPETIEERHWREEAAKWRELVERIERSHDRLAEQVDDLQLKADCWDDGGEPAFDEIATLCGCPQWEYPGQVIRDVQMVVKERDELRAKLEAMPRARDAACAAVENLRPDDRESLLAARKLVNIWLEGDERVRALAVLDKLVGR